MSAPAILAAEVIVITQTWNVRLILQDENGDVIDLSQSSEAVALKLYLNGALVLTRTKGVAGETAFEGSAGTDGDITFLTPPSLTSAFAEGRGYVEVIRTNSAVSPAMVTTHAFWVVHTRRPKTSP